MSARSASGMRHAARSRGPTALETVRSSSIGTANAAAAVATPKPSMPSTAAPGWRSASSAARAAVPVTVDTVSAGPVASGMSATRNASPTRATRPGSASNALVPKPSSSIGTKPSAVCAPRSAATTRVANTVEPTGATSAKPPPIPALITRS